MPDLDQPSSADFRKASKAPKTAAETLRFFFGSAVIAHKGNTLFRVREEGRDKN